jgi:toxin ParE1/3/4
MSRLRISPAARADLLEIWSYVAEDRRTAADRLIEDVVATFRTLLDHPEMGCRRDEFRTPLRSFPVRRYVIYYRLQEDGIEVFRILHSAREAASELHDE